MKNYLPQIRLQVPFIGGSIALLSFFLIEVSYLLNFYWEIIFFGGESTFQTKIKNLRLRFFFF